MLKQLWQIREEVRNRKPLIYNITNNVVTNFTANVLLAVGASPIMSEGAAEAEDLAKIADAVILNIGTLHTRQISYCLKAGEYANKYNKPVVFDPVGVGATAYRDMTSRQILQDVKLSLIRGNYGEISFLTGISGQTKGVDSASRGIDIEAVKGLALQTGAVIAATGQTDYVTNGYQLCENRTGHAILQMVTGTGCALSSLTGAFIAVAEDPTIGVLAAMAFYGAAAEKAAKGSKGPASFAVKFVDALYNLSYKEFKKIADESVELVVEQEVEESNEERYEESNEELETESNSVLEVTE